MEEYDYAIDGVSEDSRDSYDDYDASDNYNREYGDRKRSYRDEPSDEESVDSHDAANDENAGRDKRSRRGRAQHSASSDASQEDSREEPGDEEPDERMSSMRPAKDATVQELISLHLTTLDNMFKIPMEYLANLRKQFDKLVQNRMTPLQFKEELAKMLDEWDEDMDGQSESASQDDNNNNSDDDDSISSDSESDKKRTKSSKKRKRSSHDDDDADHDQYGKKKQKKTSSSEYKTGIKRVKIVDEEDRPVDLKDLASLGIKKPATHMTHGRITLGEAIDNRAGTDKPANVPLVPGRRDPVFKTKSYIPPRKM